MSRIVFRLEANEYIGLGHLYRCLTLANYLKQYSNDITFFLSEESENNKWMITKSGFQCVVIPVLDQFSDAHWIKGWLGDDGDLESIIVDHYGLDHTWEREIRPLTDKLVVLDDLANRNHECDYLVDMSFGRASHDYESRVQVETKLLLGTEYCLLRPEFSEKYSVAQELRKRTSEINSIVISIGATDPNNYSTMVLNTLEEIGFSGTIRIITSSQNPHVESLLYREHDQVRIYIDTNQMTDLLLDSDLAIGALGGSVWERASLGLPSLCLVTADNQKYNASVLEKTGAINIITVNQLKEALTSTLSMDYIPAWQGMSQAAFSLCDGLGVYKVSHQIFGYEPDVALFEMTELDMELLFDWQTEPGSRKFSRNESVPNWDEHQSWFLNSLMLSGRRMWKIQFKGLDCGYVRLDKANDGEEVSVLLSKRFRRMGLATAALNQLKEKAQSQKVLAHVHPMNQASGYLFSKAGFQKVSEDTYQWEAR